MSKDAPTWKKTYFKIQIFICLRNACDERQGLKRRTGSATSSTPELCRKIPAANHV